MPVRPFKGSRCLLRSFYCTLCVSRKQLITIFVETVLGTTVLLFRHGAKSSIAQEECLATTYKKPPTVCDSSGAENIDVSILTVETEGSVDVKAVAYHCM